MKYPNSEIVKCPEKDCGNPAVVVGYSGNKTSGYRIKYRCSDDQCPRNANKKLIFVSEKEIKKEDLPKVEYEFIFGPKKSQK